MSGGWNFLVKCRTFVCPGDLNGSPQEKYLVAEAEVPMPIGTRKPKGNEYH